MLAILITVLLAIAIYVIYLPSHPVDNFEVMQREGLIYTDENTIIKLYKMIYIVDRLFKIYNIDYWAEGGTLLGAIRHQGIIPWDEDADLQILDRDEGKIEWIRSSLTKFGYEIMKTWWGYKISPRDGSIVKGFNWKYPGLDIFVVTVVKDLNDNDVLRYKYPQAQEYFKRCWSYYGDIFPLKRYKFGSFEINGPNNPYTYLSSCYGSDWYDVAYMEYNHEREMPYKKVKINLTDDDRVPAIPLYP
jgi:lipopolysaccharide cholinephosphotransferase